MNYNEFMKKVDKKLSSMSEVEKTEWLHNLARTIKEHERIAFLNSLNKNQGYSKPIREKEWIEEWCRKVENDEIYFECSGYEEYGESYWDRGFVYEYDDIFEIGKDLLRAFKVAEDLLFQKEYEQVSELYDYLCNMSFPVFDRDAEEWDELELGELIDKKLVSLDFRQIALNLMYAKHQTTDGEKRVAALYEYLISDMFRNIKIEEILTIGPEELKGIDSFMEEWIAFLKNMNGDRAGELLLEACIFQGGVKRLCDTAREMPVRQPVLYLYACEYLLNENNEFECEKLGLEAIQLLPENLIIRGGIAELTAKAAKQLKHSDIMNQCYEAAFYSESTLNNYLRLFELPDYQIITDKAAKYVKTLPEDSMWGLHHNNKQMMVNSLSKEQKNVICFLNGEFDYIYEKCKKDKTVLGWSSQFKGIAIPLFILLLSKNKKITKAGQQLINGLIHRVGFIENDINSFRDQFISWKEKIVLTNVQHEKYIAWLKAEVDKRTEAVVGGGYRNSYYKAAALITAIGETLESNGKLNGRMVLIEHYKKMYTRKRAFKAEFEMLNE